MEERTPRRLCSRDPSPKYTVIYHYIWAAPFIVYTTTTSEQYLYILFTNSTSGQHFYISSEQHHIFYTTTSEQNFYILHHCYNWAALLSNRSQSELLSVPRSPGRSRNQRKTLFPRKQQSIATLLGLKAVTEDELDLRALLWLQEFLPFHFPKAGYPRILVDTSFYQTFYQPHFPLRD